MQTEQASIEMLLRPRYKVIAPWPEMGRWLAEVGDIITEYPTGTARNQNGDAVPTFEWDTFPHLFRKLEWWEERRPEEMPGYVKTSDSIFKVDKWDRRSRSIALCDGKWLDRRDVTPATESEYNSFLQSQKQNQ